MQKECSKAEQKQIISDAVEQVTLQREHWKHLPMEKQVELGLKSLGNKLNEKNIKLACGVNSILMTKASEEHNPEARDFLALMASEAGRRVLKYE
jgi:hypothetical protein